MDRQERAGQEGARQESSGEIRGRQLRSASACSALIIDVLEASRRRLGFLLCGYALMPDYWHALIWPQYPLLIEEVLHDAKKS